MESGKTKSFHGHRPAIRTFCLILARGGSKGIPHKNIYPVLGKPMIAYTLEAARQSKYIDAVYVSTDDPLIAETAAALGAEVISRPKEISEDVTPSWVSALHALDVIRKQRQDTFFMLLQCTSPLRKSEDIDRAVEKYMEENAKCLVSVCLAEHHPLKMFTVEEGRPEPVGTLEEFEMPRQSLKPAFRTNGAIYIRDIEDFLNEPRFMVMPFSYYVMDGISSIDVDELSDITYIECLLREASTAQG